MDPSDFSKLIYISLNSFIAKSDIYGRCPTLDCPQIYLKSLEIFKCDVCNFSYCTKCLTPTHEGFTCQQSKKLREELSEEEMEKLGIKICSNCKARIQKNGGCNHLTCKQCNHHMCWVCGEDFEKAEHCTTHIFKQHVAHTEGLIQLDDEFIPVHV